MTDTAQSRVRLFLSVDVVGSTALKNLRNHTGLLKLYGDRNALLEQLSRRDHTHRAENLVGSRQSTPSDDCGPHWPLPPDDENSIRTVLYDYNEENFDWAAVISNCLRTFHSDFSGSLERNGHMVEATPVDVRQGIDHYLWKAIGDELVYVFDIEKTVHIHYLVVSFLQTLRENDRDCVQRKKPIRLKASGWVAGFPIRNREVAVPFPTLYRRLPELHPDGEAGAHSAEGPREIYEEHPYPKKDFWGPDIDIGFRLGQHSFSGMMVVSMELARLLCRAPEHMEQVRGAIVGWQNLKGVWNENPYPVVWVTLPQRMDFTYDQFHEWDQAQNKSVHNWQSQADKIASIEEIRKVIDRIRTQLPDSLGLVEPYIVRDGDTRPKEHETILQIINAVHASREAPAVPDEPKTIPDHARPASKAKADAMRALEESNPLEKQPWTTSQILFRRFELP